MIELDEDLWFGTPGEDAELEERAAESMAAVAARVLGAKPFPAAAKRLEELTRSPNTKIQQVVAVLESDPGLSMRLLRLVNSAGYALRVRCTSVRHAAALVGMRRLHQLATTAAVLDLFDGDRPVVRQLLTHAAIVGALSRYLAVHVDLHPDELFTCGFLHDIGKLMLLDAEGESYLELVELAGDQADTLHLFERERYGFDHAVLGAHVLKSWKIPDPVPRVVAWHHSVGRAYQADPATAATVQALRLADNLSYLLRAPDAAAALKQAAESDSARYLGISEPQLASMWQDLARLAQRIAANPAAGNEAEMIPREESMPPEHR
ncbi:MAG TPA: HDOD domain-containing protein, partial [Polyangiaceae bacterium]